ncbi:hypothetical protein CJ030_MR2G007438 [Morella rubra]|uniref:Uncharacterized protein n=1 Tax=Morella rubra TaxID=262757 RepID=A0A6A1WBX7_9ROSI|nr:hypothetical protein CJ030_MR2G007438 [Morella rubra]
MGGNYDREVRWEKLAWPFLYADELHFFRSAVPLADNHKPPLDSFPCPNNDGPTGYVATVISVGNGHSRLLNIHR